MSWVYIRNGPKLFTVGYYQPDGTWVDDEDFTTVARAAARVSYLNGGAAYAEPQAFRKLIIDCHALIDEWRAVSPSSAWNTFRGAFEAAVVVAEAALNQS